MGYGVRQVMQMFMNFCTFMQTQRTKGRLNGLGASMVRPWMHRGFVRVLGHVCLRLVHVCPGLITSVQGSTMCCVCLGTRPRVL